MKITCSISDAPRPPYSLGQEMPAHPASYSLRCHARRYAKRACIDSLGIAPLDPILGHIRGEPGAHFIAELQFLRRKIEIHWASPVGRRVEFITPGRVGRSWTTEIGSWRSHPCAGCRISKCSLSHVRPRERATNGREPADQSHRACYTSAQARGGRRQRDRQ